uniref:Uncharacterized protein n=1 Tax=Ascaris lumbricoides TaxID=6252 RepID=A0A0M3I601_ASCLU
MPIEERANPCNDRGGLNVLGAARLLCANYAYEITLAIRYSSQCFDTINQPQCSDTFNSHHKWGDVDTTTDSRSSTRGQHNRRQLYGRYGKTNPYR